MWEKYQANFNIALEAILANKVRSILTALGIIFGVGAVIAMLAVGNGAQQEILEQIKLVGVNNIVIKPIVEQVEEDLTEEGDGAGVEAASQKNKFSPGLNMLDVRSITDILPSVERISPEIEIDTYIVKNGIRRSAKLIGVEPSFFQIYNFELSEGAFFSQIQLEKGSPVCIIGKAIATRFFSGQNPIGKRIKCGTHWLTIVGVLEERLVSENTISKLGIRDFNMDVYTPFKTVLIRYKNRSLVTKIALQKAAQDRRRNRNSDSQAPVNYHQLDRLVIQIKDTEKLAASADIIARMLERRHYGLVDYEITIPELLLKQQQRTKDIFNIVLGAIAGISLIVGGIGIMNIMLASVLERIKEIGLRISLGAKKIDIVLQFLFEAVLISLTGGLLGVILGVSFAFLIASIADIPTIVSVSSIAVSFLVAASVGLIFGITPAKRAAEQDPIACLRYE